MRKFIFVLVLGLLIAGCSTEFYNHDTLYKNSEHMKFSLWEYKDPTSEAAIKSSEQGWWGEAIPYIAAE